MKFFVAAVSVLFTLCSVSAQAYHTWKFPIRTKTTNVVIKLIPGTLIMKNNHVCGLSVEVSGLENAVNLTESQASTRFDFKRRRYCGEIDDIFDYNDLIQKFNAAGNTLPATITAKFEEVRSSYTKDDGQPDLVDKCERLLHESVLVAIGNKGATRDTYITIETAPIAACPVLQ
jgi:hypothetical protein